MQLNPINCESTNNESDTENTISTNMINVKIDNEPIIYEQPIYSHIYQNHDQFLLNYYTKLVLVFQHPFMSDLEFRPIHKLFRVTISSIKYMKDSNSDMISLDI